MFTVQVPVGLAESAKIPPNLIARLGGIFVVYEAELVFPYPPDPAELTVPLIEQMCELPRIDRLLVLHKVIKQLLVRCRLAVVWSLSNIGIELFPRCLRLLRSCRIGVTQHFESCT